MSPEADLASPPAGGVVGSDSATTAAAPHVRFDVDPQLVGDKTDPMNHDADPEELPEIQCAKPEPAQLPSSPKPNDAIKIDVEDSELSDLDDDVLDVPMSDAPPAENALPPPPVDDIGEIVPDHWSGTVPVFKPTMHQFKDFKLFVRRPAPSTPTYRCPPKDA